MKKDMDKSNTELQHFSTSYKKTMNPMIILQLLSEKPMYPYQIQKEAKALSNGEYIMPLLYKPITRLQEQGYVVEDHKDISEDNRVRVYYSITEAGREYLEKVKSEFYTMFHIIDKLVK